jgi:hypothetical protein
MSNNSEKFWRSVLLEQSREMLSNCKRLAAECDEAKKKATAIIAHLWQALSAVNSLFDPPQLAGTFSHTLDPLTQRSVDDALKLAREWLEWQWGIPVLLPDEMDGKNPAA